MTKSPLVSCVIPTHNRADLLPRAISSIQNQTYKNLEIIIVSDGSTDNTKNIVDDIAKNDNRIKFFENIPAQGGNVARNTGIELSEGEYVAFLDDDDEWLPEKIERQLEIMESDESIGFVYTGVHIIYVNEKSEYNSKAREIGNLNKRILLDNCVGTTSTVMVRKDIFKKAGVFDVELKALQDYDLWIRICQHCNVGMVCDEMINYYNYTGTAQVSALTKKYEESFAYINKKYEDLFSSLSEDEALLKKNNETVLLINKAMRNGDKKLARSYAKKALGISFSKKNMVYYLLSFFKYKTVLKIRSKV